MFLDGMPPPFAEEKLENDENLHIKCNKRMHCSLCITDTQQKYTELHKRLDKPVKYNHQ